MRALVPAFDAAPWGLTLMPMGMSPAESRNSSLAVVSVLATDPK